MKKTISLVCLSVFVVLTAFAQSTTVTGTVTDNDTGETLIGLSVYVKDSNIGTTTDVSGQYSLSIEGGLQQIVFSYTGYEDVVKTVEPNGVPKLVLHVKMGEAPSILDVVTVTGSLYEKKITEETVTIDVISAELIKNKNNTSLSEVIQRLPGVEVIDGQPNIRSGSGYAYGAGSRVAVLVDDQPLLSADLSDVKWNFIPIENAGQVEIIKGSSSVLYGSSALNGVINVRMARATETPYTYLSLYSGVYSNFKDRSQIWWNDVGERPYQTGMYMAHRQKLTPNLGLVIGGNLHFLQGFLKGGDEKRARFNFDLRYNSPKNERLSYGVSGNLMYHSIGDFFIWGNDSTSRYTHIDAIDPNQYSTFSIDPWLTYFDGASNKHTIRTRFFDVTKLRGTAENAIARIGSVEYRFQRKLENGLAITAGAQGQYFYAKSVLFGRDSLNGLIGDQGTTFATYAQMDKKFFNKLNTTLGVRWETFNLSGESTAALPVFRLGLNYPLSRTDFLRTSFGQGYRVPSFAERFIDDDITEGIHVYPNPELLPESGWSAEIGYKKAIEKKNWTGYIDAAFFVMEYKNMVEFLFDLYEPATFGFGFKSVNISQARIAGTEFTLFGEGSVAGLPTRLWTGYTYSFPGDLSTDTTQINFGTYLGNAVQSFAAVDSAEIPSILKYRSLHTARFDLEADVTDKFTIGTAINYKSYVHNIDEVLEASGQWGPLVGQLAPALVRIQEYRNARQGSGDVIIDLRFGYSLNDHHQLSFITNNLLNRDYTVRAGKMGAPRLYSLKYQMTF